MYIVKYAKEVQFHLEKKNQEIIAALQYKQQPKWKMSKKKIQAPAYNGARTVFFLFLFKHRKAFYMN